MTPAETARNEAAKQAVVLAFAVLGIAIMIPLYRRMGREFMQSQLDQAADPVMQRIHAAEARQRSARKASKRWDRLSTLAFRYGPARSFGWAWKRGEAARKAYEAERP